MRSVLIAALVCGLLGCSAAPPQLRPPACRHNSKDCSPDAVRARVLEAFSDVKVQEVLACMDEPSLFCYSVVPDHEACLVRLEELPWGTPNEQVGKPSEYHHLLRALVGKDESRYSRTVHRERPGRIGTRAETIYVNGPGNLAVLYLAEPRCFNIGEIT